MWQPHSTGDIWLFTGMYSSTAFTGITLHLPLEEYRLLNAFARPRTMPDGILLMYSEMLHLPSQPICTYITSTINCLKPYFFLCSLWIAPLWREHALSLICGLILTYVGHLGHDPSMRRLLLLLCPRHIHRRTCLLIRGGRMGWRHVVSIWHLLSILASPRIR